MSLVLAENDILVSNAMNAFEDIAIARAPHERYFYSCTIIDFRERYRILVEAYL